MPKYRAFLLSVVAVLVATLSVPQAVAQSDTPITDPIPEEPITSGLGIVLEEFTSFPKTEPTPPPIDPRLMRLARINYLGELPDGSGRLYVPDLNGILYFVEDGAPHTYLDVRAAVGPNFWSGRGLGSGFGFVTFHPEFAQNGKFYTVHTEALDALQTETPDLTPQPNTVSHGVLTEWTATDPSASTFSGTRREVLRIGFGSNIHGYQQIDFNPTAQPGDADYGLLYIAAGDGGRGTSTDNPQDLSIPQGKILRIDPAGTNSANGNYGIPASNPFVGQPGALGEIYAYGMRDPHRFSWDPGSQNRMFLGHIGEHEIEAVYDVRAGDNLGWSEREGPFVWSRQDRCNLYPLPEDDAQYGYDYPVAAFDHDPPPGWPCTSDSGHAIVGGFVYRGADVPDLQGKYVFGDLVNGRVYYTNAGEMRRGRPGLAKLYELMVYNTAGERVTMQQLAGHTRVDMRFGRDAEGELYVLSKANGKIWKVVGTHDFAGCDVGDTVVTDVMAGENWGPVTPSKWEFTGTEAILKEPGTARPGPRRPFEYAVLTAGPEFGSTQIDAEVRIDTPVSISNRDVIIVFGYRSDTQFYYAHLSTDNTIYPHNGIFRVNNADRVRIEDQWNPIESHGAEPAITDAEWHQVRVVHCADSGEIAVYVDGNDRPLMTTVDTTFDLGRVGFGSFDNIGRLRNLTVTGTGL